MKDGSIYPVDERGREILSVEPHPLGIRVVWTSKSEQIYTYKLNNRDEYEDYLARRISQCKSECINNMYYITGFELCINALTQETEPIRVYQVNQYIVEVYEYKYIVRDGDLVYTYITIKPYIKEGSLTRAHIDLTNIRLVKLHSRIEMTYSYEEIENCTVYMRRYQEDLERCESGIRECQKALERLTNEISGLEEALINYISETGAVLK